MDKLLALRHQNTPHARRRLFQDEDQNPIHDNLANILQESRIRDSYNMKEKWNFDFDNEEPLDGKFQWYKLDKQTWVSVEPKATNLKDVLDENFEKENHATPRNNKVDVPPVIRKRRRDDDKCNDKMNDKGAKRKISFD